MVADTRGIFHNCVMEAKREKSRLSGALALAAAVNRQLGMARIGNEAASLRAPRRHMKAQDPVLRLAADLESFDDLELM